MDENKVYDDTREDVTVKAIAVRANLKQRYRDGSVLVVQVRVQSPNPVLERQVTRIHL